MAEVEIKNENLVYAKPKLITDNVMHYCPGCSHGTVHKLIAEVIEEMGFAEKTVGVSPVGCSVFAYNYIDIDWIEAAHGRALAVATAVKRLYPGNLVFTYQGDGDLSAIGTAESIHAAARGDGRQGLFARGGRFDLQQRLETLARGLERVARTEHAALLSAGRYQGRKIRDAMKETLIIAGFGGQGVLSMGKILAYSGVMQDFEVTWMPSYGPEMRGGTANVTVILSDRKISSPIAHEFDTAIILNQQSMEKFEPMVRPGGILIYDTNGITRHPVREDIEVYAIDATAECARMGQAKLFNTMILGGYLKVRPVVEMENVMVGLKKSLPERAWKMLPANEEAIRHGGEIIRKVR